MPRVGATLVKSGNRKSNLIVNGAMDFAQRSVTPIADTSTGGNYRTLDRWLVGFLGVATPVSQRVATPTPGANGPFIAKSSLAHSATFAPGNQLINRQRIESTFIRQIVQGGSGKLSFGFWIRSGGPERVKVNLDYPTNEDNWSGSTSFFSDQITIPVNVWNFLKFENIAIHPNANNGIRIDVINESIAFSGSADTWFTEAVLNEGISVMPFERAGVTLEGELRLCQRYFEKTYPLDRAVSSAGSSGDGVLTARWPSAPPTNNELVALWRFATPKRTTPVVTWYNPETGTAGEWRHDVPGNASAITHAGGTNQFGSGVTNGTSTNTAFHRVHGTADAEL